MCWGTPCRTQPAFVGLAFAGPASAVRVFAELAFVHEFAGLASAVLAGTDSPAFASDTWGA